MLDLLLDLDNLVLDLVFDILSFKILFTPTSPQTLVKLLAQPQLLALPTTYVTAHTGERRTRTSSCPDLLRLRYSFSQKPPGLAFEDEFYRYLVHDRQSRKQRPLLLPFTLIRSHLLRTT